MPLIPILELTPHQSRSFALAVVDRLSRIYIFYIRIIRHYV
jgi:hypothetical protein